MSKMLNLVDCLLARGRFLQQLGRDQDALVVLQRLAGFRQLPPQVAEETQLRLAEIHWDEAHGIGRREFKLKLPFLDAHR